MIASAGHDASGRGARFDASDEASCSMRSTVGSSATSKPIVKEYDHADRYPTQVVEQMRELGLFGATVGAEYGGLGLPATTYAQIVMRISAVWMSVTGIINSHLMLALAIEKFGTPAQKATWLPKLASGEIRGGLALTEPDAGTDLQGIRNDRAAQGGHYVIDGTTVDHERSRRLLRRSS
jgi:alkylation response protein AidB-like acyl-CoA dehydrogenase